MPALKELPLGIVGAGRVGSALGVALRRSGYHLAGVSARSATNRDRAARLLDGVEVLDAVEVARRSEILLVSVPDDAISPVTAHLAARGGVRPGQLVLHASGACGLGALADAAKVGAVPIAMHPAMTFPGLDTDADHLRGLAFAVTASPPGRDAAEELVRDLGGVPVWIDEADRTLYHAALVLGANNLISLLAAAMQALGAAGVADPGFVLGPLVRTSLENTLRMGDEALTGPVRRADLGTIGAHLRALAERVPELVPAYVQFALVTAERARAAGLADPARLDAVVDLLTGATGRSPAAPTN